MSPQVLALMKELGPALIEIVQREVAVKVAAAVDEKIQARDLVVPVWRGAYVAGQAYGPGAIVESAQRLYRATTATAEAPSSAAADWLLVADVAH